MARTYRKTRIEKLCAENPQFELFLKSELKLGRPMEVLSAAIKERFGHDIPRQTLQSYYTKVFRPETDAETLAYRKARAEAHSWISEMKADPDVDATKIAEVTLARQIVANSSKLADADIMALLAEQRRRLELDQRRQALEHERDKWKAQVEAQKRAVREATDEAIDAAKQGKQIGIEAINRIRERVFGLPEVAAAGHSA